MSLSLNPEETLTTTIAKRKCIVRSNSKGNQLCIAVCLKLQIDRGKQQNMGAQIGTWSTSNKENKSNGTSSKSDKQKGCQKNLPEESVVRVHKIFQCLDEEPATHVIRSMTLEHADSCFEDLQVQNLLIYYRLPTTWLDDLPLELPLMIAFKNETNTKIVHMRIVDFSSAEPGEHDMLWSTYKIGNVDNEEYRICFKSVEDLLEYYCSLTAKTNN